MGKDEPRSTGPTTGGQDYRRACSLLRMAAHDLSVPLAAIRLQVSARERRPPYVTSLREEDWLESLARIDKLAANALHMIDDVLAVERLHRQSPSVPEAVSSVDAEKILRDVIGMQAIALERAGCSISVKRRDDLARVLGAWNRSALERLFGNLIQNVVRHAPGAPIEVSFARRDERLQIHFADGGPGLSQEQEAGATAAEAAGSESGHGLGLWIVYRTVAEMGGEISMQSRAGRGLSFDIRLPFGR